MTSPYALPRHPEYQYLDLLRELIDAPPRDTRNDTATRSVFGRQMRFDLANGFPLLTTKKLPFRVIAAELLWMLSGSTNVRPLQAQGIKIWDAWADKNGDLGPVYGAQMRRWDTRIPDGYRVLSRAPNGEACEIQKRTKIIDQVADVLQGLRVDPHGRRHVMTLWNPVDLPKMALPPCHGIAIQFYVETDGRLSLFMHQRSADAFLGLPFNIASYALLLTMFASALDRTPGVFIWSGGDCHLYGNHIDQARQQILREPRTLPTLSVVDGHTNLDDWAFETLHLAGYEPWPHIAGEVSA